ncbi:MAG: BlaI/MecI/CopY family transcriptional regulator, partial [Prevotellaceae bacterium]|nr:BlaI/MecI/CopY family transcriptional regulator [Prevotellaceae bacterium]
MTKVLTRAEEQIMQSLWKIGKGGLRDIVETMPEPRPHVNTVATVLKILIEKGFVRVEPVGRVNLYKPKVTKDKYSKQSMERIVTSYFDGSYSNAISFLVD